MTDWQLVKCELLRSGEVRYTFRFRCGNPLRADEQPSDQTCFDLLLRHPRADLTIAEWYTLEQVTAPERKRVGEG